MRALGVTPCPRPNFRPVGPPCRSQQAHAILTGARHADRGRGDRDPRHHAPRSGRTRRRRCASVVADGPRPRRPRFPGLRGRAGHLRGLRTAPSPRWRRGAAAQGVGKGDRVAVIMRNLPEWPVAFFAAASLGAIVTPLNAWWTGPELEYGLADSGDQGRDRRRRALRADDASTSPTARPDARLRLPRARRDRPSVGRPSWKT